MSIINHPTEFVWWDRETNLFYKEGEVLLDSIYDIFTPNQMLLFRDDPGQCIFHKRFDREVMCEIVFNED